MAEGCLETDGEGADEGDPRAGVTSATSVPNGGTSSAPNVNNAATMRPAVATPASRPMTTATLADMPRRVPAARGAREP